MAQAAFTRSVMFGVLGLAFVVSACGDESSNGDSTTSSERVVVETTAAVATTEQAAETTAPVATAAPVDTVPVDSPPDTPPPSDAPPTPDAPPPVDVSNVAEFALGATATYDDSSTVTVLSYTQPFEDPFSIMGAPAGIEFGVVTVQICAGPGGTKFLDLGSWEAIGAAGEPFKQSLRATPTVSGLIMLPIEPNVCVDGDVGFEVPVGQPPTFVLWSDPAWEAVKWRIG